MKDYYIPLIIATIAGSATLVGNIFLFFSAKSKDNLISFSLGLAFIVMFLISVFDLIPQGLIFAREGEIGGIWLFFITLFLLMSGYFIVKIIDNNINNSDSIYKVGILSMISLLIHNIPEGILCAITSSSNIEIGLKFSFMIMIHNIPEGICISLPIYYATGNRGKAFFYTLISSLGEFIGAIIALSFLRVFINNIVLYITLIVVAGIMISLSVFKIFNEALLLRKYRYFIIGILIGLLLVFLTL